MSLVRYEVQNRIARITLNRPEKRNAFSFELVKTLRENFKIAAEDKNVKVIILRSEGSIFSAGADLDYLQSLQTLSYEENLADSSYLKDLYAEIYTHPKVVIAAVQGHAIAGGCGLVTVSDFVFSVPQAQFGYTEVKIGFVPAIVMTFLLRKIGEGRAKELLLSGDLVGADLMKEYGIVNRVVEAENLETEVEKFALHLCETCSAQALTATKRLIAHIQEFTLPEALQRGAEMNAKARGFEDCKKGISAFLNKEKIVW